MKNTKKESVKKKPKLAGKKDETSQALVSVQPSQNAVEVKSAQTNLSVSVATQLLKLMSQVTEGEVTPATVNAACNCAKELHKIIRTNIEMNRL